MLAIHDRLTTLRRLLEATENRLADVAHEENAASYKARHCIALMNLKQVADEARAAERDLADALIHPPFQTSIGLRQDRTSGDA